MVICALCGNEEIEKPRRITKFVRYGDASIGKVQIDFGAHCFSRKREACNDKVDKVVQLLIDKDLEETKINGFYSRNRKIYRW